MINNVITSFSNNNLIQFFRKQNPAFEDYEENLSDIIRGLDKFSKLIKLGEISYDNTDKLMVFSCSYQGELSSRSSRKAQYEIAKKALKEDFKDGAVFVFYDQSGKFRFSFIRRNYGDKRQKFTPWRRYTFFVDPQKPNKTFKKQIEGCKFDSLDTIRKAFSIEAVTDEFYNNFKPHFDRMASQTLGDARFEIKQDLALLFVIRTIFIGFVQKRRWLGDDDEFLQHFWQEYKLKSFGSNDFYKRWLEPLFFEALNTAPGSVVAYQNNEFSDETKAALKMAPYLNGELFKRKDKIDTNGLIIPDQAIDAFFEFLFQYNFTIEENTRYDEDLELNPEFLGIIFERLVNKENGAVYTPRTEVDFMCRMTLVKWLQKTTRVDIKDLYHLFFKEISINGNYEDYQKEGDFSIEELKLLIKSLKSVSVCDPASGSGAFPVGMMQVLNEILELLQNRDKAPDEYKNEDAFDRKKAIIINSLYGVEVKRWAVWINQLRLWLSLFVDIPAERENEFRYNPKPLLPNLDFKIRCGDSLVQRVGNKLFPVHAHNHSLSAGLKAKINILKKDKIAFFYNQGVSAQYIRKEENSIFRTIIDEQIKEKKKELLVLKRRPEATQTSLFESVVSSKQLEIIFDAERIEALEQEINILQEERTCISDEHPLIWNIEFAEIFYEKKGFDIIIGNPPYVRQEDIGDPYGNLQPKEYKAALQEIIREEYPAYFRKKEPIDGKSDLYAYFYLKTLRLLNPLGVHCFICSNSWLDVGYGVWMQKFLLNHCRVHFILDNQAMRSFASADVNTIISVMDAPVRQRNTLDTAFEYKFVAFKKPFEEVIFSDNLIAIENQQGNILNNEAFRSYPVAMADLMEEGSEFEENNGMDTGVYVGDKWGGKYLKAPELVLKTLKSNLVFPLNKIVSLKYGLKTGKVKFFYIDNENINQIEPDFLFPAVVSSQHLNQILIQPTHFIFNCSKSKDQLKHTHALRYIDWGEQKNMNLGTSVESHRPFWYSIECPTIETVFFQFWDKRFFTPYSKEIITCSNNFCYGIFHINKNIGRIIVNSTFFFLQIELFGLNSQGQGVLTTYMEYDYTFIKMPIPEVDNERSINILSNIETREILDIFQESGIDPTSPIPIEEQEPQPLPDRKELDDVIFDALGLDAEERKEVYRAVCRLVWNRVSKARSV